MLVKVNGPLKICTAADLLIHINWWNKANKQKGKKKSGHSLKYFLLEKLNPMNISFA